MKMMKKLISLTLIVALFFCSCNSEEFLDTAPPNNVTIENFFRNPDDVEKAVNAVYSGLQPWSEDIYFYLSEIRSDNFTVIFSDAQRDWADISNFNDGPQTDKLREVWQNLYQVINRANVVMERIGEVEFSDEALKQQYLAEARFLRAFSYFQLVRLFNRVPLVDRVITAEEGIQIGQSEPAEIYSFITEEMSAAIDDLPGEYDPDEEGRFTKWAAKGILAKVYLTMAGFPLNNKEKLADAKPLLKEIMDQGPCDLHEDFGEMFTYLNDNKFFLAEIQYLSGGTGTGNTLPAQVYPNNLSSDIALYQSLISAARLSVTDDLLGIYDPEQDERFDATFTTTYETNDTPPITGNIPFISKFMDPGLALIDRYDWPINFPLLRCADVLLSYATILNEQQGVSQEAIALLNQVRERADLDPIFPDSTEELALALEQEYRREFAGEGQYWFYLIRNGRAVPVMNNHFAETEQDIRITQNDLIYPIPLSEMTIYPGLYTQNPE